MILSLFLVEVFLLSGCGFHLKGFHDNGRQFDELSLIYPVYEKVSAAFRQEFQQQLIGNKKLASNTDSAGIKIIFFKEDWKRKSLTVSDIGIPVEYRISCTISYRIIENGSEVLREITESRDFQSNNSQILAVDRQQSLLKQQILQKISHEIIYRLR